MDSIPLQQFAQNLSQLGWTLLQTIHDNPNLSKKELHEYVDCSYNTFNIQYNNLMFTQLIQEQDMDNDKRYLSINLTEYGKQILNWGNLHGKINRR